MADAIELLRRLHDQRLVEFRIAGDIFNPRHRKIILQLQDLEEVRPARDLWRIGVNVIRIFWFGASAAALFWPGVCRRLRLRRRMGGVP